MYENTVHKKKQKNIRFMEILYLKNNFDDNFSFAKMKSEYEVNFA